MLFFLFLESPFGEIRCVAAWGIRERSELLLWVGAGCAEGAGGKRVAFFFQT